MSPSFDHVPIKRRQKQSTKHNKQPQAYITNEWYEEPLEQRKARIVPRRRKHVWKENVVIGDSHLNKIGKNIFQKLVNGEKHTLIFFEALHLRDWIIITLQKDHPDVVLLHSGP